ncbi:HlyD family secretion protein [Chitinophaga nivalis]|uniref:HlyD family secretion protein n=1 Tax=Chitinophaga nivalis TaxID=2991709 RepID=A0ABT3IH84_9BACT|nr:HlyD family secretion protein [Chitinophaga nivalis]MCW3466997.1 HlyD family secretion protein [Chitinophaga nivalis]MCW3483312.1 HlyD family secretion protein [Chitinophaga nivalis]
MAKKTYLEDDIHSEDLQEIIARPPSWLMKRGISLVLLTILLLISLSVFIRYPEMVPVSMKFNTSSAPKALVSRVSGNLVKILAKEGQWVEKNTDIAYLESTADHARVIDILNRLKAIRNNGTSPQELEHLVSPTELDLGELQGNYQNFYTAYLNYRAVNKEGILQKRKAFVQHEVTNVNDQNRRIQQIYELQKSELALAEAEYEKYRLLAEKRIISPLELQRKQATLLIKRQAIPQMENTIIGNQSSLLAKDKELTEINNQMIEEEKKFYQSLNTLISEAENWKKQYVITASSKGYLVYGDFLQENQLVKTGDLLFYINAGKEDYYGEILIPQAASSKVKRAQRVLIKVRSYPFQEYGYLKGSIDYISDIPVRDSLFFSRVVLTRTDQDSVIKLKPGILADAEIITEDQSIFKRIWFNLTKSLKF